MWKKTAKSKKRSPEPDLDAMLAMRLPEPGRLGDKALERALNRRVRASRDQGACVFSGANAAQETAQAQEAQPAETPADVSALPSGMRHMDAMNDENEEAQEVAFTLDMVYELLRHSLVNPQRVTALGFRPKQLRTIMQAIVSLQRGAVVPEYHINGLFRDTNRTSDQITYERILRLDPNADRATVEQVYGGFIGHLRHFKELLDYMYSAKVSAVLEVCNMKDEVDLPEGEERPTDEAIFTKNGFDGSLISFDADEAEANRVLGELREAAVAGVNVQKFLLENFTTVPACGFLYTLQTVLGTSPDEFRANEQIQRFNGDSFTHVFEKINGAFPDMPELNRRLVMHGRKGDDLTAILTAIVANGNITDTEDLKRRLAEIHRTLGRLYPDLLVADDPVRTEMDAELMAFYKDFWADKDNTRPHFYPLYHIYNALKCTEEEYDREYRDVYFNGQSRDELMRSIDTRAKTRGLAKQIQRAAQAAESYRTALIRFVAVSLGHTQYGDALKSDVIRFSKFLAQDNQRICIK